MHYQANGVEKNSRRVTPSPRRNLTFTNELVFIFIRSGPAPARHHI